MSTEFESIGNCVGKNDDWVRAQAVEAALVLINSRISACDNVTALKNALEPTVISDLADNIEAALKNTK